MSLGGRERVSFFCIWEVVEGSGLGFEWRVVGVGVVEVGLVILGGLLG